MQLKFCTLFNSTYLSRGLTLYKSLLNCCNNFHLYIFAFDDATFDFFNNQNYRHLTVISLKKFEDEELLRVKQSRTAGEYCWTCTSSSILYCLENFSLDHCTYIDADMMFFNDPQILFDEMKDASVVITKHNYTERYDQSAISGIYCVQFATFKNDSRGMKVLQWWRNACIEWCYARVEDGKFGDQKYLDDWTTRFEGVHVLKNPGGGLAPWNVQQYKFFMKENKLAGKEISSGTEFPPIFYHFHQLKFYNNEIVTLTANIYELSRPVRSYFYKPYVKALEESRNEISSKTNDKFDPHGNGIIVKTKDGKNLKHRLSKFIKSRLFNHNQTNRLYDYSYPVRKFIR